MNKRLLVGALSAVLGGVAVKTVKTIIDKKKLNNEVEIENGL